MPDYTIVRDGEERSWQIERQPEGGFRVTGPDGQEHEVDAYAPQEGRLHLLVAGRAYDIDVRLRDSEASLLVEGEPYAMEVLNARQQRMRAAGVGGSASGGPELRSPMAGKVVAVHVSVGQEVSDGETLLIIEAMKMENDIKAHRGGVVAEIGVEAGQAVDIDDILVRIDDQGESA